MKDLQTKEFYDFVGFRLDTKNRLLWRSGETVALTPKEFELLLIFVESAGSVLGKDELLERIWKGAFVEESTLARNISWLRKKLAVASANNEKFIETIPKRGYRFLPEVKPVENFPPAVLVEEQSLTRIRVEETVTIDDDSKSLVQPSGLQKTNHDLQPANYELQKTNPEPQRRKSISFWFVLAFGFLATAAIGFAASQIYFQETAPKAILPTKIAPFSALPGRENMPAFSPDGKQLAFSWNGSEDGANVDVYVKLIGAGEPLRLTTNDADDINPTFSPDGRYVAFVRVLATHNELLIVPIFGGAERKICDFRRTRSGISFAPDGRTIALKDGEQSPGIFLVNVENGEKKQLTAPPPKMSDDHPAFSPDGRNIAFVRGFAPLIQEIFIAPVGGGEPRQLTFDKSWIGGAAWSAGSERIIFASQRSENKQTLLWQVAAAGGTPELIETGGKDFGKPAVSPDGQTIAYVEDSIDMNIWRLDPAKQPAPDSFRKLIASSRNDHSPQLAPDGARLVYSSNRTGNYEIWISDANGSNERQLTNSLKASSGSPRFSPDGRFIAYDSQHSAANEMSIFIMSVEGGEPRRLTDVGTRNNLPSWSADGQWIYFTSNRSGNSQLWKIPATGEGKAVQMTKQGAFESYAAPDGKTVFYSKGTGIAGLWRVSVDGGDEMPAPELSEAGYWRSWTIAGNGIYYVARNNSGAPFQIKFYDFASGRTQKITETDKPPLWNYAGLSASANGETLFYARLDRNSSSIIFAELGK